MKLYGRDLIKALSDVSAPSGNEERAAALIIEQIGDDAEVYTDRVGNVIAKMAANGGKERTMLVAHMDEPGFIVKEVDGDGKVRFRLFGGVPSERISGRRGVINGDIPCLFAAKPIHALSGDERAKPTATDRIYAEVGAKNKDGVKNIKTGDYGTFAPSFGELGRFIKGKALGSRTSCAVLIETIRRVASSDKKHGELYFAFTTLGEVGNMGAEVAANVIAPDRAVIVDGVQAYDTPDVPGELNITKLGAGAVISGIDAKTVFAHARVDEVIKCAEENGIKYQYIVRQSQVGEGAVVQRALGGCECIGISIPTRYKKSASETVCEKDIEQAAALILAQI